MPRILISRAKEQAQGEVNVAGWVNNIRTHKNIIFIDLRDISGVIQLVFTADNKNFNWAEKLHLESVIEVSGQLQEKPSKQGTNEKDFELLVTKTKLISLAAENLPIPVLQKDDSQVNLDARLNWRWLDLRQANNQLIFKVWTKLEEGFRNYWLANDFIQIYTPSFMSTASESGSEVFAVKYFDRQAYLSQSPQFYKQMAMAAGLEKVFVVGPVFRAEPSATTRHVSEFTGWDFEISYIDSQLDIMVVEEDLIIAGFKQVKKDLGLDLEIPSKPFPQMTFAEVKAKLKVANIPNEKDYDFSPEEERAISEIVQKEFKHDFLFITDYPVEARPFYHMRYDDRPEITKSYDLMYRGIEISTGAQREHRLDILEKQALEKGMDLKSLSDYLNFFRYGCPNHGGVGIGPGRLIMKMLNIPNIKEVCFLPRDIKRLRP